MRKIPTVDSAQIETQHGVTFVKLPNPQVDTHFYMVINPTKIRGTSNDVAEQQPEP